MPHSWAICCSTSPERVFIDQQQASSSKVRYNSGDRAHGTAARSSVRERAMRLYSEYGTLLRWALDFGERFSSLDEKICYVDKVDISNFQWGEPPGPRPHSGSTEAAQNKQAK